MFRDEIDMRHTRCEYDSCVRTARYGSWDGPALFCQDHKRAGMYTVRNGKWMRATMDGNAFRIEDEPDAASAGKPDGSSPYKRRSQEVSVGYSKRREREEKRYRARDPMNTEKPTDAVKSKAENDSTANGKEATQVRQPIVLPENTQTSSRGCDAPGCFEQAGLGVDRGANGPFFCDAHKNQNSAAEKANRSCIYPACKAKACYGFPGARAVYCADHKKGPMICLLPVTGTNETAASAPVVATTGEPSGKEASTPPANDVRQPNDSKPPNGHAGGVESEGSTRSVSNDTIEATSTGQSHESSPSTRSPRRLVLTGPTEKMSTPPKPMPASESQATAAGLPFTIRPEEARSAPISSVASEVGEIADGSVSECPTGGAPSAEMRILQHAREKARAEAEASGRGRRARVPSLKALQAAGLMEGEGAQVMTRARELEEREKARERREVWKAAVAVGLRPGQVLEAFTPELPGTGGSGEAPGISRPESKGTWRSMKPAEILSRGRVDTGPKPVMQQQNTVTGKQEASGAESYGTNAAVVEGTSNVVGGKRRFTRSKSKRQSENCRKRPKFGEDGVAHCCKKHEGLKIS